MSYRFVLLVGLCAALGCRTSTPIAHVKSVDGTAPMVRQVAFHQEFEPAAGSSQEPQTPGRDIQPDGARVFADTPGDERPTTDARFQDNGNVDEGSLDELTAIAMSVSPAIGKLEAEIEALKGKHCQAGLLPNPMIGINGTDINEAGSPGRYGVNYGNTIVRGNKLRLSQNIVSSEIRQAEMELVELRQRLTTDVKLRYYQILVANKQYEHATQLVSLSGNAVDATRQLLEAKEIARTALIQAELEMQNAIVQQQRARNKLTGVRRNLAALIGESDLPYKSFSGSLVETDPLEIETQFERLLSESPELARLYAGVEVARSNLARQRVQPIGNVTWQAEVGYDFGSQDVVSGFQIGLPIPKYNQNQGAICQARQQMIAAANSVEMRSLQLRQKLVQSYQTYRDAKLQVESYEAEVLPKARESLELITEGFQQGEVDFLQLLTAQRTYFQFNLGAIEQQGIMWRERIGIEGLLLSGSLDPR